MTNTVRINRSSELELLGFEEAQTVREVSSFIHTHSLQVLFLMETKYKSIDMN